MCGDWPKKKKTFENLKNVSNCHSEVTRWLGTTKCAVLQSVLCCRGGNGRPLKRDLKNALLCGITMGKALSGRGERSPG